MAECGEVCEDTVRYITRRVGSVQRDQDCQDCQYT